MNANVRSAGRRTLTRRIGDAVRSCLMKQPAVWRRGERGSNPGEAARARAFFFFKSGEEDVPNGGTLLSGGRVPSVGDTAGTDPLREGLGPLHRFTCGVSGADTGSAFFSGTAAENLGVTNPTNSRDGFSRRTRRNCDPPSVAARHGSWEGATR